MCKERCRWRQLPSETARKGGMPEKILNNMADFYHTPEICCDLGKSDHNNHRYSLHVDNVGAPVVFKNNHDNAICHRWNQTNIPFYVSCVRSDYKYNCAIKCICQSCFQFISAIRYFLWIEIICISLLWKRWLILPVIICFNSSTSCAMCNANQIMRLLPPATIGLLHVGMNRPLSSSVTDFDFPPCLLTCCILSCPPYVIKPPFPGPHLSSFSKHLHI